MNPLGIRSSSSSNDYEDVDTPSGVREESPYASIDEYATLHEANEPAPENAYGLISGLSALPRPNGRPEGLRREPSLKPSPQGGDEVTMRRSEPSPYETIGDVRQAQYEPLQPKGLQRRNAIRRPAETPPPLPPRNGVKLPGSTE